MKKATRPITSRRRAAHAWRAGGLFNGTPFEGAPPDVQRDVIVSAQITSDAPGILPGRDRRRLRPGDGFRPARITRRAIGLEPTGRLDVETLAALSLLPEQRRRTSPPPVPSPDRFGPD